MSSSPRSLRTPARTDPKAQSMPAPSGGRGGLLFAPHLRPIHSPKERAGRTAAVRGFVPPRCNRHVMPVGPGFRTSAPTSAPAALPKCLRHNRFRTSAHSAHLVCVGAISLSPRPGGYRGVHCKCEPSRPRGDGDEGTTGPPGGFGLRVRIDRRNAPVGPQPISPRSPHWLYGGEPWSMGQPSTKWLLLAFA